MQKLHQVELLKDNFYKMKSNKYIKRVIPILRIPLNTNADYDKICEVPEFKKIMMLETLLAIKEGIIKNKKSISLFEISDSKHCLNIDKKNWKPPLNTVMKYFIELEDYDKAIECRELLKQI